MVGGGAPSRADTDEAVSLGEGSLRDSWAAAAAACSLPNCEATCACIADVDAVLGADGKDTGSGGM